MRIPLVPQDISNFSSLRKTRLLKEISDSFWNPYSLFPILKEYTDIPSPVLEVMGHGASWVIVKCLYSWGMVYKIPKDALSLENLSKEYENHENFYIAVKKWKKIWEIPEYIYVPLSPEKLSEWNRGYHIQEIEWNTLHSLYLKRKYKQKILTYLKKFGEWYIPAWDDQLIESLIEWLNDYQVQEILTRAEISRWIIRHIHDYEAYFTDEKLKWVLTQEDLWMLQEQFLESIQKFTQYCQWEWLTHKDTNGGNIMIGKDGKIFIIDFEI